MVTKLFVLIFVLFFVPQVAFAQAYEYVLAKGDTVSHVALRLTRNAANWRRSEVKVINTRTQKAIPKSRYNRVYPGWVVQIDKQLVKTVSVEAQGKTLIDVCTQYASPNCAESLRKINGLRKTTSVLDHAIFVPEDFVPAPLSAVNTAADIRPAKTAASASLEHPVVSSEATSAKTSAIDKNPATPVVPFPEPVKVGRAWGMGFWLLLLAVAFALALGLLTLNPERVRLFGARIKPFFGRANNPLLASRRENLETRKRMETFAQRFFEAFEARLKGGAPIKHSADFFPNSRQVDLMIAPVRRMVTGLPLMSDYPNLKDHAGNVSQDVKEIMAVDLKDEPFVQDGRLTEKVTDKTTWVVIPFRMTG